MFKNTAAALLLASGLLAAQAQAQAASYSNLPAAAVVPLDALSTSVGETFIAPSASLQGFSFYTSDLLSFGSGNASFVIASWNGNDTPGTTLYSSSVSIDAGGVGVSSVGVSGLNLSLTAGSEYVAYLTVDGVKKAVSNAALLGGLGGGAIGTGLYASTLFGNIYSPAANLAYSANFAAVSAVPEPGSYVLLLAGLALTAGLAARRRRG